MLFAAPSPLRSRSTLLVGLMALTALLLLAGLRSERAEAAPQRAATANSFIESIGVATHFTYTDTAYGRFAELKSRLAELGVHHIREDLLPNRPDQYQHLNELAAQGIGSTLIMGSPGNGIGTLEGLLGTVRSKLARVDALEGPNEYYLSGQPNWTTLADNYQRALYEKAKANPATASIPVLGPTTIFWQNGELGNISNYLDYGTIHPYPGGYPEEEYEGRHIEFAARSSAAKPVVATETGYHNALNSNDGHPPVSEAAAATYMPRVFLSSFEQGVARTFVYELVDEQPNPELNNLEDHFGLLRNDLTPKPAFTAIENMIGILEDPGAEFTPGSVDYQVSGNTESLHKVLLQKRDGSYYLALWRATSVWNPTTKTPIEPGAANVTVRFNTPFASVQRYTPNTSAAPVSNYGAASSVNVSVGPQVTILELTPSGSPSISEAEAVQVPPVTEEAPAPTPTPAPIVAPVQEEVAPAPPIATPAPVSTPAPLKRTERTAPGSSVPGASKPKPTASNRVKVWVAGRGKGARISLRGRVSVAGVGDEVAVQERSGRTWRTIQRSRTDGSGSFNALVDLASTDTGGPVNLRVSAPGAQPSAPLQVAPGT